MKSFKLMLAGSLLAAAGGAQAIVVIENTNALDLANAITGAGITIIGTPSLTGDAVKPSGTFTGGAGSVGFDSGIVLTTGTTDCVAGPNNQSGCTGGGSSSTLSFDFTSTTGMVFFQYVFASEEYTQYAPSQFNDKFELLLNGLNIAMLPAGAGVVEINNVNCLTNSQFYRNNVDGEPNQPATCVNLGLDIQYDGLTVVLTASGQTTTGTNRFDFKISDVGDTSLDSGVFIKAGSFTGTNPGNAVPEPGALALLGLGLAALAASRHRRS